MMENYVLMTIYMKKSIPSKYIIIYEPTYDSTTFLIKEKKRKSKLSIVEMFNLIFIFFILFHKSEQAHTLPHTRTNCTAPTLTRK